VRSIEVQASKVDAARIRLPELEGEAPGAHQPLSASEARKQPSCLVPAPLLRPYQYTSLVLSWTLKRQSGSRTFLHLQNLGAAKPNPSCALDQSTQASAMAAGLKTIIALSFVCYISCGLGPHSLHLCRFSPSASSSSSSPQPSSATT
jgi:hypothetical protein